MSYALVEINVPSLVVNDGTDFTFDDLFVNNETWNVLNPAYMRMMNNTSRGFLVSMKTGSDSFWLRAGDSLVIPLAPNEKGFGIICKYIEAVSSPDLFLLTFYTNREEVPKLEPVENPSSSSSSDYPAGAIPITATSANVANAQAQAQLAAVVGKTTYISGFQITGSGATAGLPVIVTIANVVTGTMFYIYTAIAGVLLANTPLIVTFKPAIPANAPNTIIFVTCPALGAGNTNNTVNAQGYQL